MAAATTTNPKPRGSDNSNNKPPEKEITTTQPHYHTIDIRAFLLLIAVTMTASFMAGVMVLPPTPTVTLESGGHPATEDGGGAEHRPSGQHLLVDIKGVDADFLNSEELLSQAMVDTVQESGLTLLSYHCHFLAPSGVSCVGILLESHSESSILFLLLLE